MELSEVQHADFRENGFMVVRNVLAPDEVETLRQRADEIISDVETYRQRDTAERQRLQELHKQDVEEQPRYNTFAEQPEERIIGRYARRGDRVYPVRQRPVDEAAVAAAQASDNPWQRFGGTIDHLADNDAVFRKFAAHPNVVKVLQELLAPNLKLWFDHLYNKPPYNNSGPYGGANRFHQDGFFQFSRRSVTCWIALDEVTEANGCFHYVPITADYGQVQFDEGVAEELTAERAGANGAGHPETRRCGLPRPLDHARHGAERDRPASPRLGHALLRRRITVWQLRQRRPLLGARLLPESRRSAYPGQYRRG